MSTRQRKPGELQMVELRAHPVVHRVAVVAGLGQLQSDVVDAGRSRINEILLVARVARCRQTLKLTHGRALVTGIAVHGGVRANQREAIEVLIDLLNGNVPASDRVALLAIRAHLPLMNIGVAICALRAHIGKDHLGVALCAGDSLVQAAQWVFGGVVIEFRDRTDRLPAAQGMAVLARNAKASMRTSRVGGRLRLPARRLTAGEHRKCDDQMQQNCRSQGLPNPF